MIFIKSIGCSLAFAPYLQDSLKAYLETGSVNPSVVRQAASGMILRADDGFIIHYENRDAILNRVDARHYYETVEFRQKNFQIVRTSNEVVLANFANSLLLSHPQSELWLNRQETAFLVRAFTENLHGSPATISDWLSVSEGGGSLLLSDGRNGRWVLLGEDHRQELERRLSRLRPLADNLTFEKAPTIRIKGLNLQLQAAYQLLLTLEEFASTGSFSPYDEIFPNASLRVTEGIEGMKITDGNVMISILPKEARKWVAILEVELEKFKVQELKRGEIKTVLAKSDSGIWVLQSGDEICLPTDRRHELLSESPKTDDSERLISGAGDRFKLILDTATGSCIALSEDEMESIHAM